jgi:2-dehydropantoate 2-reductase
MKIGVMGAGGLGGYFGARLAAGGADVSFIARGAHLAAMHEYGLSVEGPEPIHVPKVKATCDPAAVGPVDLVIFAVKLWDTEETLRLIAPMVGPHTTLISFQNGVLKDDYLRTAYAPAQIMGGVGYVATTIDRPGVIRQTGPMQRLIFGEFDGARSARAEALLEACLKGGIKAEISPDIRRDIWQKFVFRARPWRRSRRGLCRAAARLRGQRRL